MAVTDSAPLPEGVIDSFDDEQSAMIPSLFGWGLGWGRWNVMRMVVKC